MRITRFPSISETQFLGCAAAFVDALAGELNAAAMALRRLEGTAKGSAFAHEMTLDAHRYGALIVLDRWSELLRAFAPHLVLSRWPEILRDAPARIQTAEDLLRRTNELLDAAALYTTELVEAAKLGLQSVNAGFPKEREAADNMALLGPMLPDEYKEARRIFLEDLAAR